MPVDGNPEELKRTKQNQGDHPAAGAIDLTDKDITADALLTQRKLADYLVTERHAHYHFTLKGNQPTLYQDLVRYFEARQAPDFVAVDPPDHGRIETRKIWTTTALSDYLDFPHVAQAYLIERHAIDKKSGKPSENPRPDAIFGLHIGSIHHTGGLTYWPGALWRR